MTFAQRRPIAVFLLAAVLITYLVGPVAFLLLRGLQRLMGTSIHGVNDLPMKFGPTLAGFLTVALVDGGRGVKDLVHGCLRWRLRVRLYLLATFIQVVVLLSVLLAQGHGAEVGSVHLLTALRVFGLQLLLNVFLGAGLSQEIGLEQVQDAVWNILYYDTLLGRFDERTKAITGAPSLRGDC